MAFSYIFFEVLDLDGSNFPMRYPVKSSAVVPEVETNIVRPHFVRLAEPWTDFSSSLPAGQVGCVYQRLTENLPASAFNLVERRGYRAALPRSSIPDDFRFRA